MLAKLKLTNTTRKPVEQTPEQRMRSLLVAHLEEQREMAAAMLQGRAYQRMQTIHKVDVETGNKVAMQRPARLQAWYWQDSTGKWLIELRYGNTVLALAKDKCAVEVGPREKLEETFKALIEAVQAGELDAAMKAAVEQRKGQRKKV